jgi:hypothetical protein
MGLNSLTQQSECAGAESGCLRILSECSGYSSMRLGVPFIAPRQLGAVEDQLGRPILPSIKWCTGQSGVPLDSYCSCPVLDFFPYGEQPTVGPRDRWAHRTVRCAQPTVGATTCRAEIARPTVGAGDRWLTGQSSALPDCLVNYSRTPPSKPESGEFTANWPGAPDSPVCQTEQKIGCTERSFSILLSSSLVTVSSTWITMLVHKTIHQV